MAYGVLVSEAVLVLRRWLDSLPGEAGARLPSERALARQLGLKHYAVNRAVNRLITEGRMERTGYKLAMASSPRSTSSFSCEVVLSKRSGLSKKSYRRLAKELGLPVNFHYYEPLEEAVEFLRQLDKPETRSVIFEPPHGYPSALWEPAMERLLQHGIAAISVGQYSPNLPSIIHDYSRALELAFFHLRKLGHRELALLTIQPRAPAAIEVVNAWQSLCLQANGHTSLKRIFFQNSSIPLLEDARDVVQKLTKNWKTVTALIVYSEGERVLPNLLAELARRRRHVPQSLSLLCLGDGRDLRTSTPAISATAFDFGLMQETGFAMAQRMVRKKQAMGLLPPPWCLRLEPHFIDRTSIRSLHAEETATHFPGKEAHPFSGSRAKLETTSTQELRAALKRCYPLTMRTRESNFTAINLSPFVNRPLNFRRGWLGDLPLKSLTAGTHRIHGIPFHVLGGSSRSDRGAVVFRSTINTIGNARLLPSKLRIPIGRHANAVYMLHGCGYARFLQHFATYQFFSGAKQIGSVPLVTLGQAPSEFDPEALAKSALKANIQDWWSDFPHLDFPHARRAPLRENEDEIAPPRHAYIYTLEWINPTPQSRISHMTVSVDSAQLTTLGLLAVSILNR